MRFFEQVFDRCKFRDIQEIFSQKVLFHLNNYLLAGGAHAVIKVEMRNVWPDKDQIAAFVNRSMVPYMPCSAGAFNVNNLKFRMKMPQKCVIQAGCEQDFKRTSLTWNDLFPDDFHGLQTGI